MKKIYMNEPNNPMPADIKRQTLRITKYALLYSGMIQ